MVYVPSKPPAVSGADGQALAAYLDDEMKSVAAGLRTSDFILFSISNKAPVKPRQGQLVYADGTHWNPGSGEGLYVYGAAGSWVWLEDNPVFPKGHIFGLTLSTAGSSSVFGVAAGEATDSTGVVSMKLVSAYTKTTSVWAQGSGNGALDTGVIANSTWYHAYLIEKTDKSAVEVTVSLSATTPTLQSGWTFARRLGAMKTNGSAQWTKFIQFGDRFVWDLPVSDVANVNPTAATNYTLSVPTGLNILASLNVVYVNSGTSGIASVWTPSNSDPSGVTEGQITQNSSTTVGAEAPAEIWTNTSAQVTARTPAASGNGLYITTKGWLDPRGRDM